MTRRRPVAQPPDRGAEFHSVRASASLRAVTRRRTEWNSVLRARRSGKNLLELLIVISIIGVVMATGMRLMHVLFRAERTGTRKAAETVSLAQLGREFRRDVRASASASLVPSPSGRGEAIQLHMPDGRRIAYIPAADRVERRLMRGDEPESRQSFRLPGRSIRFELEAGRDDAGQDQTGQATVTLVCESHSEAASAEPPASGPLTVRIVASVSRDHRFAELEP